MSAQNTLESLERFEIDQTQMLAWEKELGLEIPVDGNGEKHYSRLHINLFKNIKKHLILGRSLEEIKRMVILPPPNSASIVRPTREISELGSHLSRETHDSPTVSIKRPEPQIIEESKPYASSTALLSGNVVQADFNHALKQRIENGLQPIINNDGDITEPRFELESIPAAKSPTNRRILKRFASQPIPISKSNIEAQPGQHAGLMVLIERLMHEKDSLQNQLLLIEKQKSHLFKANELFEQQIKTLKNETERMQNRMKEEHNLKLMDDKSKLQKQVIDAERRCATAEKDLGQAQQDITQLRDNLHQITSQLTRPERFIGNWLEEAQLQEIAFDNFGINIENERSRLFRITQVPTRVFGQTAIIETQYDYPSNTLWKRAETLIINLTDDATMQGEMIVEYLLDGTIIAKAIYEVTCSRNVG